MKKTQKKQVFRSHPRPTELDSLGVEPGWFLPSSPGSCHVHPDLRKTVKISGWNWQFEPFIIHSAVRLGAHLKHRLPQAPGWGISPLTNSSGLCGWASKPGWCRTKSQCFGKSHLAPVHVVCVFYLPEPRHSPKLRDLHVCWGAQHLHTFWNGIPF